MTETSTNRNRFIELAEKRVARAIKALRLVGNLSNRTNYSYTDDEVKKIIKALETEIKLIKSLFNRPSGTKDIDFKL